MVSTLDLGMSYTSSILEWLVTGLNQVVGRTLDAPRWCVIGRPHLDLTHGLIPQPEWVAMGGQICDNCADCRMSE